MRFRSSRVGRKRSKGIVLVLGMCGPQVPEFKGLEELERVVPGAFDSAVIEFALPYRRFIIYF
jgi:hypothetical protein